MKKIRRCNSFVYFFKLFFCYSEVYPLKVRRRGVPPEDKVGVGVLRSFVKPLFSLDLGAKTKITIQFFSYSKQGWGGIRAESPFQKTKTFPKKKIITNERKLFVLEFESYEEKGAEIIDFFFLGVDMSKKKRRFTFRRVRSVVHEKITFGEMVIETRYVLLEL